MLIRSTIFNLTSRFISPIPAIKMKNPSFASSSSSSPGSNSFSLIARPLTSSRTNPKKKSNPSSASSDIEEVFIKPQDRISVTKNANDLKGKGEARENQSIDLTSDDELNLIDREKPNYSSWTLTALQKEAAKYTTRKLRKKEKVIRQLDEIWEASKNPTTRAKSLRETLSKSGRRKESDLDSDSEAQTLDSDEGMGDETLRLIRESRDDESLDEDEVGDLTFQLLKEAEEDGIYFPGIYFPGSKNLNSISQNESQISEEDNDEDANQEDEEDEEDEEKSIPTVSLPTSVSSHLKESILKERELYKRILLFEPIALDEIMSIARKNKVNVKDRIEVRSWLDSQGITNFSDELTGKRSRH